MAIISLSSNFILIGGLLLCGLAAMLVVVFVVQDFRRELHYINMEIQRNSGTEREYWMRKRKRLWLSLLPFTKT